jgi:hypothetical protein
MAFVIGIVLNYSFGCSSSHDKSRDQNEDAAVEDSGLINDASTPEEIQKIKITRSPDGGIVSVTWLDGGGEVNRPIRCQSKSDCDDVACLSSGYCDLPDPWTPPTEADAQTPPTEADAQNGDASQSTIPDASESSKTDAETSSGSGVSPFDPPLWQKHATQEGRECKTEADCTMVPKHSEDCCAPCIFDFFGSLSRVSSMKSETADAYMAELCADITCEELCDPAVNWYFENTCENELCFVSDLRTNFGWTNCTQHSDCHVRTTSCCECGGPTGPGQLLAVSDSEAYAAEVCSGSEQCSQCEPEYPDEVMALCSSERCILADPRY